MAGRGRAATLPAWMTGGSAAAAPGAPAATGPPTAALAGGPAAPGSTAAVAANAAILQAQAIAANLVQQHPAGTVPQAAATGANTSALGRPPAAVVAPAGVPAALQAPSPTGAQATAQPNAAAVAAAIAAAQAAAAAAGVGGAPAKPVAASAAAANITAATSATPSAVYGARPPHAAVPGLAAPPGAAAGVPPLNVPPPYGLPPPGAYPPPVGAMPPMFRPPLGMPGFPPGMMPPPGFPGAPGMPFPGQPMYPAPAAAAAPQQQQQPKSDWSEHTAPDGRKYYYNSVTKTSAWVKPEELMSAEEKAKAGAGTAAPAAAAATSATTPASQSTPAASASPAAAATPAGAGSATSAAAAGAPVVSEVAKAWKQYTAPDGRPYYYNKITKESKWSMPEEMKAAQAAAAATAGASTQPAAGKTVQTVPLATANGDVSRATDAAQAAADQQPKPVEKKEPARQEPVKYATKEAAKEAFKQLLADFDIPPEASWDNAMRLIVNDVRYGALKQMGEKKSAFNEYCTARRAAEREEARRKQVAAKEAFMLLLEETQELEPGDSYDRAQRLLNHDGRWKDVESDALRRELFKDHMDALKRKRVEEQKRKQEAAVAAFKELLQRSQLKSTSTWRKVAAKLEDEEAYQALDRLTRLEVFQAHIRTLEEEEKQEREREKEARRRKERKNRDTFRELLQRHRDEGTINVHMRWKEYQPLVEDTEEYLAVKKNASGSRPRELFEDMILEMEEEYDKARPLLKEALKAAGWSATPDSTYLEYCEVLERQAAAAGGEDGAENKLANIRDSHKRAYFQQEVGRAKEKAAESDKKKKRALEKFEAFVRSAEGLYSSTTWEEFEDAFRKEDEFVAVGAEVAKRVFDEHIEKLKAKEKKRDNDDDDEGSGKKKKRSSRHDDDDHKKSKRHRRDRSRDKSRERSSRGHSRDHRRRSPESGEPEEGEV